VDTGPAALLEDGFDAQVYLEMFTWEVGLLHVGTLYLRWSFKKRGSRHLRFTNSSRMIRTIHFKVKDSCLNMDS
jgi:hypothetical protein